jgi:hypothetical protein
MTYLVYIHFIGKIRQKWPFWHYDCKIFPYVSYSGHGNKTHRSIMHTHLPRAAYAFLRAHFCSTPRSSGHRVHRLVATVFINDKRFEFAEDQRRCKWPQGLRHESSSPAGTLESCVRIPLEPYAFILRLCCSLCRYRPSDGLILHPRRLTVCV